MPLGALTIVAALLAEFVFLDEQGFSQATAAYLVAGVSGLAAVLVLASAENKGVVPCPECGKDLRAIKTVELDRACPRCGHRFPSTAAPLARLISWPHRLLTGDAAEAATSSGSFVPNDNPYASPASDVKPGGTGQTVGCLAATGAVHAAALRGLFVTSRQLMKLAEAQAKEPLTPNAIALVEAAARGSRRWSVFALVLWSPLLVFGLCAWKSELDWTLPRDLLGAVLGGMGLLAAVLVCMFVGLALLAIAYRLMPQPLKRWMMGNPPHAQAKAHEDMGCEAIALLDLRVNRQLPRLKLRYRMQKPGDLAIRMVNYDRAQALEKLLPCLAPGAWHDAKENFRVLVAGSEPDFVCDEIHVASALGSQLEIKDLDYF